MESREKAGYSENPEQELAEFIGNHAVTVIHEMDYLDGTAEEEWRVFFIEEAQLVKAGSLAELKAKIIARFWPLPSRHVS